MKQMAKQKQKVAELEQHKRNLESALNKSGELLPEEPSSEQKTEPTQIETKLQAVNAELAAERAEAEKITEEYNQLSEEVAEFQGRLDDLKELNDRLTSDNQSQLEAAKATTKEIEEVREKMELEAAERAQLEQQLMQTKEDIIETASKKSMASLHSQAVKEEPIRSEPEVIPMADEAVVAISSDIAPAQAIAVAVEETAVSVSLPLAEETAPQNLPTEQISKPVEETLAVSEPVPIDAPKTNVSSFENVVQPAKVEQPDAGLLSAQAAEAEDVASSLADEVMKAASALGALGVAAAIKKSSSSVPVMEESKAADAAPTQETKAEPSFADEFKFIMDASLGEAAAVEAGKPTEPVRAEAALNESQTRVVAAEQQIEPEWKPVKSDSEQTDAQVVAEPVVKPSAFAKKKQEEPEEEAVPIVEEVKPVEPEMSSEQRARRTQLEMEMELLALKKRLQAEQKEKARLQKLNSAMKAEKANVEVSGTVPDWVKKINVYASNSKTLRVKIGKAQKARPDDLSFTYAFSFILLIHSHYMC